MNAPVFTYNPEIAAQSGAAGKYITESCVIRGFIECAKWVKGRNGAEGIEFSFDSEKGQKANFMTVHYKNNDGSENTIGTALIHSIMGCTGVKTLSMKQDGKEYIAPELTKKPIMFALERENYINSQGEEKFKLNIRCAMSARPGMTVAEAVSGGTAESQKYWTERFAANPKGEPAKALKHSQVQQRPQTQSIYQNEQQAGGAFDDDIQFAPAHYA